MHALLANALVVAAMGALAGALYSIQRLLALVPEGRVRHGWYAVIGLVGVFIAGYASYIVYFWGEQVAWHDQVVPLLFVLGAGFVWLATAVASRTVRDVQRVGLLEQENITDPLIGIYNRRYLERRLSEEVARAKRYALPLAVLLLDIDHFKRINDQHGHRVGDLVLVHIGRVLLESVRSTEVVARYGGEEIVIIAPNTTLEHAAHLAERVRCAVESHALLVEQGGDPWPVHVEASVGVAALGGEIATAEQLVHAADVAMYQAKQAGRNRVVVSTGPVSA